MPLPISHRVDLTWAAIAVLRGSNEDCRTTIALTEAAIRSSRKAMVDVDWVYPLEAIETQPPQ